MCDNGGWTDTWFAEYGRVFNIAITPKVEVEIAVFPADERPDLVMIHAKNFGERYAPNSLHNREWGRHPLLEAAVYRVGIPTGLAIEITVESAAPSGAGTGTSAAVCVALIAALDALTPGRLTFHEIAYEAHAVETVLLGQQSGIQDQLAAAYGGVNLIEMSAYPQAAVTQLALLKQVQEELDRRLMLIFLGKPHQSSAVHEMVIRDLEDRGPENPKIEALRQTAGPSAEAVVNEDWAALGRMMTRSTEAQRNLHPRLISPAADQIINLAGRFGMMGCKVNGAGGSGGSLTILGDGDLENQAALIAKIEHSFPLIRHIPTKICQEGVSLTVR